MIEMRIKPKRQLFPKNNEENEDFYYIFSAEVNPNDLTDDIDVNSYGNISIKGTMPKLAINEEYIVTAIADKGGNFQGSFTLDTIRKNKPITITDQKNFLSSILTANQIEEIFKVYNEGQDIVGMIEKNEFNYHAVKGLGDKSFEKLQKKVLDNMDIGEILTFCTKHGIKYSTIAKLVKEYKNPTIVLEKIQMNPYILTSVKGIGFKKADEIAKAVGYSMTSEHRIDSALRYIIGEENMSGHSWIGHKQLLNRAIELLNIKKDYIEDRLNGKAKGILNIEGDRFTKETVYEAEDYVALRMTQFKSSSKKLFETDELEAFLDRYCEENGVELEKNQRQFFHDWNENNLLFLVGGGGMGKSWLQKILLELIDLKNYRTALLAPTGKASKVMSGYTGRQAFTIHRKAGVFDEDTDAANEISEDVIIVDESSMCDVFILSKFFKAVTNENARILFVGDDFQLPSVGVGNFLYDSIHSGVLKISVLTKVFRQDEGGILDIATKVRKGISFFNNDAEGRMVFGKDCVFWLTDQQFVRDGVISNYRKVVSKFNPDDVIILSPTNKGKLGTIALNKDIQKIANPPSASKKEKSFGKKDPITFRVGDSVMNTVNTYKVETLGGGTADVFNGDTGKIVDIDEVRKEFIIDFEGIVVRMKFANILMNLMHAWVTTIHKSQGSQYKVVITIIDKSMKFQLNANLLYTGLSRATQFLLVLGQAEAVNHAISKFANMERRSFLQEMLIDYNGNYKGISVVENEEIKQEVKETEEAIEVLDIEEEQSPAELLFDDVLEIEEDLYL